MGERVRPSAALLLATAIPLFLNIAVFVVTEGFNVKPHTAPFVYAVGTLVMEVMAVLSALIGFSMAKDEEPEWGPRLPFKVLQALNVFSIILSTIFTSMIVLVYFLK